MSKPIIEIMNISKRYTIGANKASHTLREEVARLASRLTRKAKGESAQDFWALKGVSFSIGEGEAVGIIGRNGAGKSTLLKILSQITPPTEGSITMRGRVASLLEVGTGFHPELTGRENIFLNGTILGMSRREVARKFDAIVDFAEVDKFLDTPVKRYSSGMYVRLAFSVAAHLEPDILVVDEVLAVGDVNFQNKCLGKMNSIGKEGRTVIFVSHNMQALQQLCTRGVLLNSGTLICNDVIDRVIDNYISCNTKHSSSNGVYEFNPPEESEHVNGYVYKVSVEDEDHNPAEEIYIGAPWQIRILFKITRKTEHFIIGLGLNNNLHFPLQTTWCSPQNLEIGEYEAVFSNNLFCLAVGEYNLSVGLTTYHRHIQYIESTAILKISGLKNYFNEKDRLVKTAGSGFLLNQLDIHITKL